jgi:hypothetical protein
MKQLHEMHSKKMTRTLIRVCIRSSARVNRILEKRNSTNIDSNF